MKSKFIIEERLSDGMENMYNDNTLEITRNENGFRCVLFQQKLPYEQRVIITLEHMQKKASRQCSAARTRK